jgi:DnaK suppressor protein
VAVKKPAKKAAKAVKKSSKPAAVKTAAKKPVAKVAPKKPASPAVKKAAAKKAVSRTPAKAVKKPAPSRPVAKAAPAKKAPAKATAPAKKPASKATPVKAMSAKAPAAKSIGREALSGPVKVDTPKQPQSTSAKDAAPKPVSKPVAKPVAKQLAQEATASRGTTAPRPAGKVAVAVAARPSAPARKEKFKVVPFKNDPNTGRPTIPAGYRPSADEEYMGPLQIEYFRQRLLSWRADLVEESKQTIENLKDEVRDVGDEAERATRETENSLELRTRDRYRKLIGKIDSTLKRVDSGEYGYSVDSGEDIGLERLEARLTAERTIDEQERWEHLQKQIGD